MMAASTVSTISHPPNKFANDYILGQYSAISYTLLEDMLSAIVDMGRGTIIKRDNQSAFRTVPVRWRWILGFYWKGKY